MSDDKTYWCPDWKAEPKTTEKIGVEKCKTCKNFNEKFGCPHMLDCRTGWNNDYRKPDRYEAEKKYRPFKDIEELIKVWGEKIGSTSYWGKGADLTMPHIWVRQKDCGVGGLLITYFGVDEVRTDMGFVPMGKLLADFTFLDGTPCGVEE